MLPLPLLPHRRLRCRQPLATAVWYFTPVADAFCAGLAGPPSPLHRRLLQSASAHHRLLAACSTDPSLTAQCRVECSPAALASKAQCCCMTACCFIIARASPVCRCEASLTPPHVAADLARLRMCPSKGSRDIGCAGRHRPHTALRHLAKTGWVSVLWGAIGVCRHKIASGFSAVWRAER